MKLIDGDRLLKLMAGGGDPDYAHHLETNLFPKCTLDPADPKESFAKAQDKPDYEAMIEDLEIDFDGVYAFQLAARSARLKDILKKVRAEHTPKSEKPEGK